MCRVTERDDIALTLNITHQRLLENLELEQDADAPMVMPHSANDVENDAAADVPDTDL